MSNEIDTDNLKELTPKLAAALAKQDDLSLDMVSTISDAAAKALAQHKGNLSLGSLKFISDIAAKALAQRKGRLNLGLESLSDIAAKALAQHKGDLHLDGLESISDAVAVALAQHKGGMLSLFQLSNITDSAAKALAQHNGDLYTYGLKTLSDAAAKALAQHKGLLFLDGLKSISDVAATALAQHNGGLHLNGLESISDDAAKVLAKHRGDLSLDGIKSLSDVAATALAKHKKELSLGRHLESLSDVAVKALKAHLTGDTFERFRTIWNLTTLSPVGAAAFVNRNAEHRIISLDGLTTISDATAKALAQHNGDLCLDGLTTLSDAAAKALAQHKGGWLRLDGLESLSGVAAKALAQHKEDLSLNGIKNLSDVAAKAFAQHKAILSFDNLSDKSQRLIEAAKKGGKPKKVGLRFEITRGVVVDETDVLTHAIALCKQQKFKQAADLLLPNMTFEWNWSKCSGNPGEDFVKPKNLKLKCDKKNCDLEVELESQKGLGKKLVLTARVSFGLVAKSHMLDEGKLNDWLSENSSGCGCISGGWGYATSDAEFVQLISIDGKPV